MDVFPKAAFKTRPSRRIMAALIAGFLVSAPVYSAFGKQIAAARAVFFLFYALLALWLLLYVLSRSAKYFSDIKRDKAGGYSSRASQKQLCRIAFHLSILVILAGGAFSAFTRQTASARVVDGYYSRLARFTRGGKASSCLFVNMSEKKIAPGDGYYIAGGLNTKFRFERDFITGVDSDISLEGSGGRRVFHVAYNRPAAVDGDKLYPVCEGYAVRLFYRNSETGEINRNLLMFEIKGARREFRHFEKPIKGTPFTTRLDLKPKPGVRRPGPDDLLLNIRIAEKSDILFDGPLPAGVELQFDQHRFYFDKAAPFVDVMLVRDRGVPVAYAGFLLLASSGAMLVVLNIRNSAKTAGRTGGTTC